VDGDRPYLLDTHVWLWHLAGSEHLPDGLRETIEASPGELWISPVSVWELGLLEQRGHILLAGGARAWVQQARRRLPLHEAALTSEVALKSCELALAHRDPADRFLAATALVHELTLMTVDETLREASWLPTRST
jgi:PIN domain nuclease of toxin-antitoxin system